MTGKEGICPLCGAQIEYTSEKEFLDNGGTNGWKCPQCGATGKEGFNFTFDGNHYQVTGPDGTEYDVLPGKDEKCPFCGEELSYESFDVDDVGRQCPWECPNCGATGIQGETEEFDGEHYDVRDKFGKKCEERV